MTKDKAAGNLRMVECGRIGRPWGLQGECVVSWRSGVSPVGRGDGLFIASGKDSNSYRAVHIAALRTQGRLSVVRFEGILDRTAASQVRGTKLYVPAERLPKLPPGEYYHYQVLGCDVFDEDGQALGRVTRIFNNGAHDVYEVKSEMGREVLIPAVDTFVVAVDLEAKKMTVRLLEGMLD